MRVKGFLFLFLFILAFAFVSAGISDWVRVTGNVVSGNSGCVGDTCILYKGNEIISNGHLMEVYYISENSVSLRIDFEVLDSLNVLETREFDNYKVTVNKVVQYDDDKNKDWVEFDIVNIKDDDSELEDVEEEDLIEEENETEGVIDKVKDLFYKEDEVEIDYEENETELEFEEVENKTINSSYILDSNEMNDSEGDINEIKNDSIEKSVENESNDYDLEEKIDEKDADLVCDSGCLVEEKCYSYGYRKKSEFCSEKFGWISQFSENATCENNFECNSNVCVEEKCISVGVWKKFTNWLGGVF